MSAHPRPTDIDTSTDTGTDTNAGTRTGTALDVITADFSPVARNR